MLKSVIIGCCLFFYTVEALANTVNKDLLSSQLPVSNPLPPIGPSAPLFFPMLMVLVVVVAIIIYTKTKNCLIPLFLVVTLVLLVILGRHIYGGKHSPHNNTARHTISANQDAQTLKRVLREPETEKNPHA